MNSTILGNKKYSHRKFSQKVTIQSVKCENEQLQRSTTVDGVVFFL